MSRPLLIDLFAGAGGAAMGYYQAGFDVLGVDLRPSPRYPFPCVRADALDFLKWARLDRVALIHASPPCQAYTTLRHLSDKVHPDLLAPTRRALQATGKPYVIENVIGAPVTHSVILCGTMFGLRVYRHRHFETSELLLQPPHPPHRFPVNSDERDRKARYLTGTHFAGVYGDCGSYCGDAMGISWMTGTELSQAIPPAFSRWIGERMWDRQRGQ